MKYYMTVLAGAISYGILSTIVVLAYGQGYQLGEVVGSQLIVGCILSWLVALYTKLRMRRRTSNVGRTSAYNSGRLQSLTWKQRLLLMAAGIPTVTTGLLYYQSLRYIPASLAIILLFQFTWIGVLIQAISKRQRPDKVTFLTLFVLFGGTLLAAGFLEQGSDKFSGWGIALGLMSAVSYSLFVLFNGKAVTSAHPVFRSAWMVTGGLILLCVLFPPTFLFSGLIWGQLLFFGLLLGFFGAFIPPILFAIGVPHIGGEMAGIIGAVELPVAVLMSSIVLHEHVSGVQWFGVILVLLGVTIPELYKIKLTRSRNRSPS